MKTAAQVFIIISMVCGFWLILPLVFGGIALSQMGKGQKPSTGISVCVLLFCSFIGGILLLCAKDEDFYKPNMNNGYMNNGYNPNMNNGYNPNMNNGYNPNMNNGYNPNMNNGYDPNMNNGGYSNANYAAPNNYNNNNYATPDNNNFNNNNNNGVQQ